MKIKASIIDWLCKIFMLQRPENGIAAEMAIIPVPAEPVPDPGTISLHSEPLGNGLMTLVRLEGMLNSNTVEVLEEKLQQLIAANQVWLLIDLSQVPYISSRGWGVLISVLKMVRKAGGDIKILGMRSNVRQLFWYAGLSNIFEALDQLPTDPAVFNKSAGHSHEGK